MSFWAVLTIVVSAAGGGWLIVAGLRLIGEYRASRTWRVVQGEVSDFGIQSWTPGSFPARTGYGLVVRYDYWVDGHHHVGYRHHFTIWRLGGGYTRDIADDMIAPYRTNRDVQVYVDPDRPWRAVLDRRLDHAAVGVCLTCGPLFVLTAITLILDLVGVVSI
ncbi:MAG TPA: DUF3592 domain-containing protein [Thermomicrobiales bacterium]|jgi:hypothetical protein|nr:DUF3592 domain-containing protein [Thermomicrobiales bacterium]